MQIPWNSIKQNKPAIFDWLVFTISLVLGLIFPRLSDLTASSSFSGWLFASLVLYISGLWLKHRAVYYRLATQGKQEKNFFYLLFLIVGHWVIMLAAVMFSEDALRWIIGLPPVSYIGPTSGWREFNCILIAAFITWFAFRPGGRIRNVLTEKYLFCRELAGDILLITGVSILSFVFWQESIVGAVAHMPMNGLGDIFLLFIFLFFAYMLFYLPLRYLYLVEDNSRQAWRRLLIIFVLILIRGLFEAMKG